MIPPGTLLTGPITRYYAQTWPNICNIYVYGHGIPPTSQSMQEFHRCVMIVTMYVYQRETLMYGGDVAYQ